MQILPWLLIHAWLFFNFRIANLTSVQVDTIAADKRFHRGSAETNLETRDIGPITKNGIYLALQVSN